MDVPDGADSRRGDGDADAGNVEQVTGIGVLLGELGERAVDSLQPHQVRARAPGRSSWKPVSLRAGQVDENLGPGIGLNSSLS
jgi:hypothetical protein